MFPDSTQNSEPLQTFEWPSSEGPAHELILAVATHADDDPRELEPLHSVVDADALDSLFDWNDDISTAPGVVEFDYLDYRIVLQQDRTGELYERPSS